MGKILGLQTIDIENAIKRTTRRLKTSGLQSPDLALYKNFGIAAVFGIPEITLKQISSALESTTQTQREALRLAYFDRLLFAEAAQILGTTREGFKSLIPKVKQHLKPIGVEDPNLLRNILDPDKWDLYFQKVKRELERRQQIGTE